MQEKQKLSRRVNDELTLIKKMEIGQSQIEIFVEKIPTEEQIKTTLTRLYDVINNIADRAERRGVDTSKWFYTSNEFEELRACPKNKFI